MEKRLGNEMDEDWDNELQQVQRVIKTEREEKPQEPSSCQTKEDHGSKTEHLKIPNEQNAASVPSNTTENVRVKLESVVGEFARNLKCTKMLEMDKEEAERQRRRSRSGNSSSSSHHVPIVAPSRSPSPSPRARQLLLPRLNLDLTLDEFSPNAYHLWSTYYGGEDGGQTVNQLMKNNLNIWYKKTSSALEKYKNKFQSCYSIIIRDSIQNLNKRFFIEKLSSEQIKILEKENLPLVIQNERRWKSFGYKIATVRQCMESETSPLQVCLDPGNSRRVMPGPKDWEPSLCALPYLMFAEAIRKYSVMKNDREPPDNLGMKIRYIEFLNNAEVHHHQLLLGVMTAFGPDLYTYPLRVIQILVGKFLIRKDSRLRQYVHSLPKKAFEQLDYKCSTELDANGQPIPPKPVPVSTPKRKIEEIMPLMTILDVPVPPNMMSKPNKNSSNFFDDKLYQGDTFIKWREAADKGLRILGLPTLDDVEYEETYNRYLVNALQTESKFMQGILTGIRIAVQALKADSPISSFTPAPVASSPRLNIGPIKPPPEPILNHPKAHTNANLAPIGARPKLFNNHYQHTNLLPKPRTPTPQQRPISPLYNHSNWDTHNQLQPGMSMLPYHNSPIVPLMSIGQQYPPPAPVPPPLPPPLPPTKYPESLPPSSRPPPPPPPPRLPPPPPPPIFSDEIRRPPEQPKRKPPPPPPPKISYTGLFVVDVPTASSRGNLSMNAEEVDSRNTYNINHSYKRRNDIDDKEDKTFNGGEYLDDDNQISRKKLKVEEVWPDEDEDLEEGEVPPPVVFDYAHGI